MGAMGILDSLIKVKDKKRGINKSCSRHCLGINNKLTTLKKLGQRKFKKVLNVFNV